MVTNGLELELGVPPIVAAMLVRRGITDTASARRFLQPEIADLLDPFEIPGLAAAVARIVAARDAGERVVVVGDYDVDGVSSAALLLATFQACGLAAEVMLPDRLTEGYGLQVVHAQRAAAAGARLLVTVDCGTTAYEAIEAARDLGLRVVVVDHHRPGQALPDDVLIVNPLVQGDDAVGVGLAAAGLAFNVAVGVFRACGRVAPVGALLRIACLGTVADMVPLLGENRTIAALGLGELGATRSVGLRALFSEAGIGDKRRFESDDIAFRIGPRLNAAGRLGSAEPALEILMTRDPTRANALARQLESANKDRRDEEEQVAREATARFADLGSDLPPILVAWDEGWHRGVVGIAAGRLARRFHRPAILCGVEDGVATGSGRSVPGISLHGFLDSWRDELLRFGGHDQAIGLSVDVRRLAALHPEWVATARANWSADQLRPRMQYDASVDPSSIDRDLVRVMGQLAPHGVGNHKPLLRIGPLELRGAPRLFGTADPKPHLSAFATPAGVSRGRDIKLTGWRWASRIADLAGTFEVLGELTWDLGGEVTVQLVDARPAF